jgi:hypothetical protein
MDTDLSRIQAHLEQYNVPYTVDYEMWQGTRYLYKITAEHLIWTFTPHGMSRDFRTEE